MLLLHSPIYIVSRSSIQSCSLSDRIELQTATVCHGNTQAFSVSAYMCKCRYTVLRHLCEYLSVSAPFCLINHIILYVIHNFPFIIQTHAGLSQSLSRSSVKVNVAL